MKYSVFFAVVSFACLAQAQEAIDVPDASATGLRAPDLSGADERAVAAYCRYAEAVGDSSSALMASPWVFGNAGTLTASRSGASSEVVDSRELGAPRIRLQAGVGFSPTRLLRSGSSRALARLECRRYGAAAKMRHFTEVLMIDIGHVGPAPLREKARVLREALAHGRKLHQEFKQRLDASLGTVDEYRNMLLKLAELEQALRATEDALAQEPEREGLSESWGKLRSEAREVEAESARIEGGFRKSQAFEVVLRGGYDRVLGVDQSVPVFASATLRFSPGWFWQRDAESRAERAAKEWRSLQADAALPASQEISRKLDGRLQVARAKLADLAEIIAELERRRADVFAVPGVSSQRFADLLWLDIALLRAEQAFVEAHIKELLALSAQYRDMLR